MIKTKTITQEITKTYRYCDRCGSLAHTQCYKCKKDLCNKCVEHEDDDRFSDYRGNCYCKVCWDLGEDLRSEIIKHEHEIDILYNEWDIRCDNTKS